MVFEGLFWAADEFFRNDPNDCYVTNRLFVVDAIISHLAPRSLFSSVFYKRDGNNNLDLAPFLGPDFGEDVS